MASGKSGQRWEEERRLRLKGMLVTRVTNRHVACPHVAAIVSDVVHDGHHERIGLGMLFPGYSYPSRPVVRIVSLARANIHLKKKSILSCDI